jgi:transposase
VKRVEVNRLVLHQRLVEDEAHPVLGVIDQGELCNRARTHAQRLHQSRLRPEREPGRTDRTGERLQIDAGFAEGGDEPELLLGVLQEKVLCVMGWTTPDGIDVPDWSCCFTQSRESSMGEVSIIGLDLAKSVFQVHAADRSGAVVLKKKLRRDQMMSFFGAQPSCLVAMEACASAHHWGREIAALGHEVRLIPPAYVKPFVKRQKTDAADAEAICEAAQRPGMRFVAVKSQSQQAAATVFRARDLLVRQRTQVINAVRGHLAEYGVIAPKGPAHVARLTSIIEAGEGLPAEALGPLSALVETLRAVSVQIADLDRQLAARAKTDEGARRLMTVPGIGPVIATALVALAPPRESFRKGRDFAAWVGLTPRQNSSGGKTRMGRTSKMGDRTLRRLLIIGAQAVVRWEAKRGSPDNPWLARMLARKPRQLVAVALAGKMARIAWAMMSKGEDYRASGAAA